MNGRRRLFIDTAFVQALFNGADAHHDRARLWAAELPQAAELWTTEAVLIEIGNAFSATNRAAAIDFIDQSYRTPRMQVVPVQTALLGRAVELYRNREDKTWGLCDCISFVVMADQKLPDALTSDGDFIQAGFRALLLENP